MRVGRSNFGALFVHVCVTDLPRQPFLPICCTCFDPLNVANAYKRNLFFSAGAGQSRQTRRARLRPDQSIIYARAMISKRNSAKMWVKKDHAKDFQMLEEE